jgi:nucleoside-diphosphate-sugar epimerase
MLNPVWIDDLALGICSAVESRETGIFHFGGPETVTLRALVETIGVLLNRKPVMRIESEQCIERHAGAFDKTREVLGYSPQVLVRDGLRRLLPSIDYFGEGE